MQIFIHYPSMTLTDKTELDLLLQHLKLNKTQLASLISKERKNILARFDQLEKKIIKFKPNHEFNLWFDKTFSIYLINELTLPVIFSIKIKYFLFNSNPKFKGQDRSICQKMLMIKIRKNEYYDNISSSALFNLKHKYTQPSKDFSEIKNITIFPIDIFGVAGKLLNVK